MPADVIRNFRVLFHGTFFQYTVGELASQKMCCLDVTLMLVAGGPLFGVMILRARKGKSMLNIHDRASGG